MRKKRIPKTHCKWGHPFSLENTLVTKTQRVCRICNREKKLKFTVLELGKDYTPSGETRAIIPFSERTSPPALNAKKTHCKWGHEFTQENTRIKVVSRKRHRICRACATKNYKALQENGYYRKQYDKLGKRLECVNGHQYAIDNVYLSTKKDGTPKRTCVRCLLARKITQMWRKGICREGHFYDPKLVGFANGLPYCKLCIENEEYREWVNQNEQVTYRLQYLRKHQTSEHILLRRRD